VPFDVDDHGVIVGSYLDAAGMPNGFMLRKGVCTTIDATAFPRAQLLGGNNRRQIVGGYLDDAGKTHGLLYDDGTFTTFDSPLATTATAPLDINNRRPPQDPAGAADRGGAGGRTTCMTYPASAAGRAPRRAAANSIQKGTRS
jgi:hypothetical protein